MANFIFIKFLFSDKYFELDENWEKRIMKVSLVPSVIECGNHDILVNSGAKKCTFRSLHNQPVFKIWPGSYSTKPKTAKLCQ